jgi:hypothetical protein
MDMILNILFYTGLSVLFIYSEPMIWFKRLFGFKEEDYYELGKTKQIVYKLITCLFCSSFWITLILSQSFILAVVVSLVTWLIENKL